MTLLAIGAAAVALAGCAQGGALSGLVEGDIPDPGGNKPAPEAPAAQPEEGDAVTHRARKPPPEPASATDPSSIPPASAGTNGSFAPPTSADGRAITARTHEALGRQAAGPTAILLNGIALAPPQAPAAIAAAIGAANMLVGRPYEWGGGHGSWYSAGYDCSGAVSFALAGGNFLTAPLASNQFESWGEPGPGRWLTVYANSGHAYAVIAGLRWDTVGDARGSGPRWHPNDAYPEGFVARHPPGY
jgi:hypothetical protein